jgi:hypothetical protein
MIKRVDCDPQYVHVAQRMSARDSLGIYEAPECLLPRITMLCLHHFNNIKSGLASLATVNCPDIGKCNS